MIRNVVLLKLKAETPPEQVERLVNELQGLQIPGLINISTGTDAGLREGNMDFVIVVDLEDEAAYRIYDEDAEHNRIRRDLVAPITERVERLQYRM
ncbi:MAG TPA: Dabb family protein [Candidatus Dormibacteraeota bacterium]